MFRLVFEVQQERDGHSKLADASTSRSIGGGAGETGVTTRAVLWRSLRVARTSTDWAHEVLSKSSAIDSKKKGLHSFSRDQERPAFALKSSTRSCPHSKRINFAIRHDFATQFSRQAAPWKVLSIGMLMIAIASVIADRSGNRWSNLQTPMASCEWVWFGSLRENPKKIRFSRSKRHSENDFRGRRLTILLKRKPANMSVTPTESVSNATSLLYHA